MSSIGFVRKTTTKRGERSETELQLTRRPDGRLWAEQRGDARPVSVRRCFPWSEPARYVSLRDDDEEEFATVLAERLEARGMRADTAVTGLTAIVKAEETRYDAILLDMAMPGMDGIELAKRAVELNAALKIMFITGFAAVALHPSSNAPKQAKVLSKPFHLREIVAEDQPF